jgi:hypothetical protein
MRKSVMEGQPLFNRQPLPVQVAKLDLRSERGSFSFRRSRSAVLTSEALHRLEVGKFESESSTTKQGGPGVWIDPKGETINLTGGDIRTHGTTAMEITGKNTARDASQELLRRGYIRVRGNTIEFSGTPERIAIAEAVSAARQNAEDAGEPDIQVEGHVPELRHARVPLGLLGRFTAEPAPFLRRAGQRGSVPAAALAAPLVAGEALAKDAALAIAQLGESVLKGVAPASRGADAKESSLSLREHLAEKQRQYDISMKAMEPAYKLFAKVAAKAEKGDESARDWILDFYDRAEKGEPQETEELDQIAKVFHDLFNQRVRDVRALGTGALQNAILNYLPHLYKDPKKAKPVLEQLAMERWARRPMQGSKAWQKQRSIDYLKQAYKEKGLEPLSWNPVDLVSQRLVLMDKYIMAHRVRQELQADGLVKYFPARRPAPPPYRKLDDNVFTVYGPPVVKVREAFDQHLSDRLNSLAASLGIKHERHVNIGGKRLGYAEKETGRVVTKFATPESVLAHEIGHQLEWKYKLTELMRGAPDRTGKDRAAMTREMRALADLRFANARTTDAFKKYVRSKDEKMANAIAALVYAPSLFKRTAPNVWDYQRDELWHIPALKPLFDIEPSMVLGTRTKEVPVGGMVIAGRYEAVEPVARVINNHLSPGLRGNEIAGPIYRALMGPSNWMNQFTLGFSGFHAGFTSFEANCSQLALAIYQGMRGQFGDSAKSLGRWAIEAPLFFPGAINSARRGRQGVKEWDAPGSQSPHIGRLIDAPPHDSYPWGPAFRQRRRPRTDQTRADAFSGWAPTIQDRELEDRIGQLEACIRCAVQWSVCRSHSSPQAPAGGYPPASGQDRDRT